MDGTTSVVTTFVAIDATPREDVTQTANAPVALSRAGRSPRRPILRAAGRRRLNPSCNAVSRRKLGRIGAREIRAKQRARTNENGKGLARVERQAEQRGQFLRIADQRAKHGGNIDFAI